MWSNIFNESSYVYITHCVTSTTKFIPHLDLYDLDIREVIFIFTKKITDEKNIFVSHSLENRQRNCVGFSSVYLYGVIYLVGHRTIFVNLVNSYNKIFNNY